MEAASTTTFDLIVIGGGPAGSSAAITAAREGWRVLLFEKGRFPRHKVCGEFVSAESLELLSWLLGDSRVELLDRSLAMSESRIFLDGRTIRVPVKPAAASIARHDLDLALWSAAQKAGVTVLQGTTVKRIDQQTCFRVATSAGEFCGRAVINASGRWSNLTRPESSSNGTRWLGLKAHFSGETDPTVDLYFFASGYCGVQPVRSPDGTVLLNACALVRQGAATTIEDVLKMHPLLAGRSRSWTAAFPTVSTFPAIFRDPAPVSGNVLNAGDAAGFVDPFIGDGISLGLRGGHLAVRSLRPFLRNEVTLKQSLETYRDAYKRSLRPVYRNSSLLRRFLNVPRSIRVPLLSVCESSPRLARFLVETTRSKPVGLKYQRSA